MTRKARVLALVTDGFGRGGGIAQYNADFLSAWAASGDVAGVEVLPRLAPAGASTPTGVLQRPARPGRIAYAAAALVRSLGEPFDVVFCGHLYMAVLAAAVARRRRARLVVQTHGIEAWTAPSSARRAAVEAADLVLSVSRYTRGKVLGWAAIPPERVRVLPNTVDDAFTPGDGALLRSGWGLQGRRVLLTVGRMEPSERYKGHDRVIEILPDLVGAGCDVVYLVIGQGGDRPRLEGLVARRGLEGRVRFIGAVDRTTLIEAYRLADVFVMASTGEGFGIAYLEAMACGTPAIGLHAGGAPDALADGAIGVVATESDLKARLLELLSRPRSPPEVLAAEVRRRFGRAVFAGDQKRILESVMIHAPVRSLH